MDPFKFTKDAAPAIVMALGTTTMIAPGAPEHVRYGGACLLGIAMILADLQSGKKLGYTDKILTGMRKIPGMENADEGTVIGALTLGACGLLGIPPGIDIAKGDDVWPKILPVVYNGTSYLASAGFEFKSTRGYLEKIFGKELSFTYTDADGNIQSTPPPPDPAVTAADRPYIGRGGHNHLWHGA